MPLIDERVLSDLFVGGQTAQVVTDDAMKVLLANKAAARQFGLKARDPLPTADPEALSRAMAEASGTDRWHVVKTCDHQGERIDLHVRRLRSSRSGKLFAIKLSRTGRERQAFLELKKADRRAQESFAQARAEALRNQFLTSVNHELRTPLTSILGTLDLVTSGALGPMDARARGILENAAVSARSLLKLVNDLLDAEQMQAGAFHVDLQPTSLGAVVRDAVGAAAGYPRAGNVSVLIEDTAEGDVVADPDRLKQIILNLLSNALKFSPPGGIVRVRTERLSAHVRLTVADEGPGIPAAFHPQVFQRFAQAEPGRRGQTASTGIGLAVVRELTRSFGGEVSFDTGAGTGTRFHVDLRPAGNERAGLVRVGG
ncbi:HAMP domain-containing histidine kinase [Parvularcula sp. ZS-1/3]|uniref:histidine kinase n=1 Tax=Parvularcula mediterranea TaxID=2732508 RepID=A0A7Y3W521_9PROT|nr:HAMP domain-containing sensor histidine kinase [Parvularcula mediterranea]NNU15786.1 HAMP domain-containing histidine kinase [Parvularcula mediterranea]